MTLPRICIIAVAVISMASCSEKRSAKPERRDNPEAQALSDPGRAGGELDRLLSERLEISRDIIIVRDFFDVYAIPSPRLLYVECSSTSGLKAAFYSGDDSPKKVAISEAEIVDHACPYVAHLAAQKVRAILAAANSR